MELFSPQPGFTDQKSARGRNGNDITHITSSDPLAKFLLLATLCFADLEVLVPEGASTGRHNNDPTELEVKIINQLLWAPQASESTGKEGIGVLAGVTD